MGKRGKTEPQQQQQKQQQQQHKLQPRNQQHNHNNNPKPACTNQRAPPSVTFPHKDTTHMNNDIRRFLHKERTQNTKLLFIKGKNLTRNEIQHQIKRRLRNSREVDIDGHVSDGNWRSKDRYEMLRKLPDILKMEGVRRRLYIDMIVRHPNFNRTPHMGMKRGFRRRLRFRKFSHRSRVSRR